MAGVALSSVKSSSQLREINCIRMPLLVVYNPVSGDRSSSALFDQHVLPLLTTHHITPSKIVATESTGHAGTILADFLASLPQSSQTDPLTVVLGSGDGTLHELINALNSSASSKPLPRIHLALVPCGTANALYSSLFPPTPSDDPIQYKLKSVRAFVSLNPRSVPLNLAVSVFSPPPVITPGVAHPPPQVSISVVVASTSLHASILHDSEALRASDPSMERFKTAARQNITRWYAASVKLFPREGPGVVEVYDPSLGTFIPHQFSSEDEPIVDLGGPFAYFLSTVNVDRLEPAFRITPKAKDVLSPQEKSAALDVIIVRPSRDPAYEMDSEGARAAFAEKAGAVLGAAYQDGAHIALRYDTQGKITTEGTGPTVVEYVRCGGWEWEPVSRFNVRLRTSLSALAARMRSTRGHTWFALMERSSQYPREERQGPRLRRPSATRLASHCTLRPHRDYGRAGCGRHADAVRYTDALESCILHSVFCQYTRRFMQCFEQRQPGIRIVRVLHLCSDIAASEYFADDLFGLVVHLVDGCCRVNLAGKVRNEGSLRARERKTHGGNLALLAVVLDDRHGLLLVDTFKCMSAVCNREEDKD